VIYDVVFRRCDGWFGRIRIVMVRFNVLACGVFGCEEIVNGAGTLIVEHVECWLVSDGFESL
jgi:hypothetical protein